ncbi:DoxX family membrane protein [Halalkalibacterium halodurans]|nr:DoxX family membrane protein [Halalkalibacterium halodurans]MDY7223227.1 DoxX family membrane protein [Halalkalibacterium halodurans]MDY7242448.1 DoxX family membrane protein [Halalkalibacterium halodurans]
MLKWLPLVARMVLGSIFLLAGLNGLFVIFGLEPFIDTSEEAMALFQFAYLLVTVKALEVICGILLLMNRFVPLSLAALSPITVNIFLLHVFLDHSLLPLAFLLILCQGYLLYIYRRNFFTLLEKKPL